MEDTQGLVLAQMDLFVLKHEIEMLTEKADDILADIERELKDGKNKSLQIGKDCLTLRKLIQIAKGLYK